MIEVRTSKKHGRGVFTTAPIEKGSIFYVAPVIFVPEDKARLLDRSELGHYYYQFIAEPEPPPDDAAVVTGAGSFFNHSFEPNVYFICDVPHRTMQYGALKDIAAGSELFINYNGDPNDLEPWDFAPSPDPTKHEPLHDPTNIVSMKPGALPTSSGIELEWNITGWTARSRRAFAPGECVEEGELLELPEADWDLLRETEIPRFRLGNSLALGTTSLALTNLDAENANLDVRASEDGEHVYYIAKGAIASGDILRLSFNRRS